MFIENRTCGNCGGTGLTISWKVVSTDEILGVGTAERETTTCSQCDGKGWTEHAVFTVEEAKVILKHCGLSTES